MSQTRLDDQWASANQRALMHEVGRVRASLERYAGENTAPPMPEVDELRGQSAADVLCARLGLSAFEREIVIMCAAPDLDGRFAALLARAHGDATRTYPTFGLALAALNEPHWSALTPWAPLRRWHLVEPAGSGLTDAPLRLDEWVLHVITGTPGLDPRLAGVMRVLNGPTAAGTQHLVDRVLTEWSRQRRERVFDPLQLTGPQRGAKRSVFEAACVRAGWQSYELDANALPSNLAECEVLVRVVERQTIVGPAALLIDAHDCTEPALVALAHLIEWIGTPLAVMTRGASHLGRRPTLTIDVPRPSRSEQRAMWTSVIGTIASSDVQAEPVNCQLDAIVAQFSLDLPSMARAAARARADTDTDPTWRLWQACRDATRTDLEQIAQRLDVAATMDDLVLAEPQRELLADIIAHVRQRTHVFDDWRMGGPTQRGLGTSVMFAGPSGTGKTLAAEAIAHDLDLDLYRIDLSQVISKYIGETEKNLRRVFDAADEGGAVLLFDEADALFGKRSEVHDSHDRYANIEISYLLQRMESYAGLAILTTNMRSSIDPAFLRRLRFVVTFPFPDAVQREQIWRRMFPASAPTQGLDFNKLARLAVSGGNIRNIALYSAFIAADRGEPIQMTHLLRAALAECGKLERGLSQAEIGGWV